MDVYIDHKLRISSDLLPDAVHDQITEALSIPNIARQKAMEQQIWGWKDMPETIALWSYVDGYLVMPRGFKSVLTSGLSSLELDFDLVDNRFYKSIPYAHPGITLRPWQAPAVDAILRSEEGIYKAPAGSGKTVAVLEAARRSNSRAIVLVNTKDIMWQWASRAKEFLGIEVGQIGDNTFEPSTHLTIATVQTLHSRYDELEKSGFFDEFSFVCLDECHHATAETYNRIVNRFSSKYRIGVSATPDKTGDFALAVNVLGPVFHETKKKDVASLIDPEVFRIPTNFSFAYRGAQGRRPSNYGELLKELIADEDRNELIVRSLMIEEGSRSLVISKRLEHLATLCDMLQKSGYSYPVLMLTGRETNEERKAVIDIVIDRPCVVFSTLADEALDIPQLDRIFLVFPQRNPGLIEQQVGRICRAHPEKPDAKVFDFHDHRVGPLDAQWRVRRLEVYQPHGYRITTVRAEDILQYEGVPS